MSYESEKQDKFVSLIGRLQFSVANEADPQAQKGIIEDICSLMYADAFEGLQKHAEKNLTKPEERAQMWLWVQEASVDGSDLNARALENYVAEIPSIETPAERAKMWKNAYSLFGWDSPHDRTTRVSEGYAAEIPSFEDPETRVEMWKDVHNFSEAGSGMGARIIEALNVEIPSFEDPQKRADLWFGAFDNAAAGSEVSMRALEAHVAEIPSIENPQKRAEMWELVYEWCADSGSDMQMNALEGYAAQIPSFEDPEERSHMWMWVSFGAAEDGDLHTHALEEMQKADDAVEASAPQEQFSI